MTTATASSRVTRPIAPHRVRFTGGFWGERVETNRLKTLPLVYRKLQETGRLDAWRLAADGPRPDPFWDSDIAKWMEAAAYALAEQDDPELRRRLDGAIDRLIAAQAADGYFNSYFQQLAPNDRWTHLERDHELYNAGHLIEAAVAHHAATGNRRFLEAMCRFADLVDRTFGPGAGRKRGYPGHPEIELALVRLHRATGEPRYLELARFFLTERGTRPHYFNTERRARGQAPAASASFDQFQAHRPLLDQQDAEGHAVRAGYLYAGLADVAAETGEARMHQAARRLWDSITRRRMYLTGGIGSAHEGERFTTDFDLPEERAYCETCAGIALVLFAHRMLQIAPDRRYGDVMERAMVNAVLPGVGLDGERFFYPNPLAADPALTPTLKANYDVQRFGWFGCACCPTNVARLLASLGRYAVSTGGTTAYVHLYGAYACVLSLAGGIEVQLEQSTNYPWDGAIRLAVEPDRADRFTLALRIPGWCEHATLRVDGRDHPVELDHGYAMIDRHWDGPATVELTLPMPARLTEADPRVAAAGGKLAIERGPVVYCLESIDNGPDLAAIRLPADTAFETQPGPDPLGACVLLHAEAVRMVPDAAAGLYGPAGSLAEPAPTRITAIPYPLWAHRGRSAMRVWIPRAEQAAPAPNPGPLPV